MTGEELNLLIERRAQEMVRERDAEKRRFEDAEDAARYDYYDSLEKTVASGRGFIRFLRPYIATNYAYLTIYTFTEDGKCARERGSRFDSSAGYISVIDLLQEWLERGACFGTECNYHSPSFFDSPKKFFRDWNPATDRFLLPLTFDPFCGRLIDRNRCSEPDWFNPIRDAMRKDFGSSKAGEFCFGALMAIWMERGFTTWFRVGRVGSLHRYNGFVRQNTLWRLRNDRRLYHMAQEMWLSDSDCPKESAKKAILRRIRRHRGDVSKSAISFFKMFAGAKAISEALKQQTNATNTQQTNRGVREAHHRGAFSMA